MKQTKAVNYISLCPHCNAIPSIRMVPKDKISINCSCGYKDKISELIRRKEKDSSIKEKNVRNITESINIFVLSAIVSYV